MKYKENWEETKERFTAWWKGENNNRPILYVVARKKEPLEALEMIKAPFSPKALYLDVERRAKEVRNKCKTHTFLAEAFPFLDINIGPGSMATYLGYEPNFSWSTIWYSACVSNWNSWGDLQYNFSKNLMLDELSGAQYGSIKKVDMIFSFRTLFEKTCLTD
ncbi:MAG: hypothetical protein Q7J78_04125 [Clostridiales bacterium]|nr:hypothetical protein [Clostridiales bacterium]